MLSLGPPEMTPRSRCKRAAGPRRVRWSSGSWPVARSVTPPHASACMAAGPNGWPRGWRAMAAMSRCWIIRCCAGLPCGRKNQALGDKTMFLRFLFLLLLALNLGAAAWLVFGRAPPRALPPATDPGVTELRLLSETRHVAPASAASASASAPAAVAERCTTLGPFTTTVDMRAAMQKLSPHVARIQYHEEQVSHSHGYWVYLPATAGREAALDEARALAAKGINDYYVVTAGDAQNTVSLGLFDDESNAKNRLAALQKLGFAAKVKQRIDTEPAYWIDYAVPANATFSWQAWLPGRNDLQSKSIDCF
ncbi:MAG: SPOR domain-containing protein [Rhodanobacteraceae bacterium]|nr:MAG: SPOR domain-containing protein [Rhodanobacteraceae bacterium]